MEVKGRWVEVMTDRDDVLVEWLVVHKAQVEEGFHPVQN